MNFWGPNGYETYSIHQLEPLMMLMKAPAKRVMAMPLDRWYCMTIEFADGRCATISGYADGSPFMLNLCGKSGSRVIEVKSDFFQEFIVALVAFVRTGQIPVSHEETLAIMAVREAGCKAMQAPGQWVPVMH